jgi:hypothetical protein
VNEADKPDAVPHGGSRSPRGPSWVTPDKYGSAEALTSMGTIAAPLLGGFSLAATVQTIALTPSEARWPDAAMVLFLLAAALFIATVQAMFWAREYQVTPTEITAWWPDAEDRHDMLRAEQARHAAGFRMWSGRARVAYNAALICLLAGLTTLAVPAGSHGHVPVLRWVGAGVGVIALAAEAAWITGSSHTGRGWPGRFLAPPAESHTRIRKRS